MTVARKRGAKSAVTSEQGFGLERHLPQLRSVFTRLTEVENNADIDWVQLLELRERADALTDDAYYRGYVMGILDALGVSVSDGVPLLRTPTRPNRRIVQAGGRQSPRVRSEGLASRKILPGSPSKDGDHAGE